METTLKLREKEDRERTADFFDCDVRRARQRPPQTARPYTIAALLAAGSGTRLGADRPKQLLAAGGRTLLEHAVAAFERSEWVDEICLVVSEAVRPEAEGLLRTGRYKKLARLVAGGATRADSTRAALDACAGRDAALLVHDAARPMVPEALIARVAAAVAEGAEGVCPVLPVADTLLELGSGGEPLGQPDRARLFRVQTPQGFRLAALEEAFRLAARDENFQATDDFGVMLRYRPASRLATVEGEENCFKVTYVADLARLTALLST